MNNWYLSKVWTALILSILMAVSSCGLPYCKKTPLSSIIVRTQEKEYFVVQLFRGFTKEGEFVKKLLISKNRKDIVSIVLPSSEEVKNFKANIKKYRTGFILETLYGGGENFYTRSFYFKCIKGNLFLYKIVGTHIIPNSDKKLVNTKNIRPRINVRNFNIQYYLENTP